MRHLLKWLTLLFLAFNFNVVSAQSEDDPFKVLPAEDEFADQSIMLQKHLSRQTQERNWQRETEVARILNEKDWEAYKSRLLRDYRKILGLPFPERTPLKAEVVRVLDRGGYRIENVIYQSMPDINVTANLYLPQEGEPPFPGILFPCGHWHEGKAAEEYHSAALGLVQKGYVVLLYDPVGQGERCDYFKPDGTLYTTEPVIEHTLLANPLFLMGKHLMTVRLWDGMRGIDYLLTRKEVDPERIGCTGNSGGGTVTAHLVPLEERIRVAVPDGTVGSPVLTLGAGGISDGEQNRPMMIPYGVTMADLMMLAWPRPYRLIIESRGGVRRGTRASFAQAGYLYRTLGNPERMSLVETEWPHGFYRFSRQKMYQWFNLWFYGRQDGWEEPELKLEKQQDLWCSTGGNIVKERGKSLQQWIAGQAEKVLPKRSVPASRDELKAFRQELVRDIRDLLYNPSESSPSEVLSLGRLEVEGLEAEKVVLYSEKDIYLPGLYFRPGHGEKVRTVILTDSNGKTADGAEMASLLVSLGYGVFAVDPRGYGETRITGLNPERDGVGGLMAQTLGMEASVAYDGLKLGRSIFAMRVYDIVKSARYILSRQDVDSEAGIALIGRSSCGPPALYAAALEDRVRGVLIDSSLAAFTELTRPGIYAYHFIDFLPRVLTSHDLPHLAGALAPKTIWALNSLDAKKVAMEEPALTESYGFAKRCYRSLGAEKKFQAHRYLSAPDRLELYRAWLKTVF